MLFEGKIEQPISKEEFRSLSGEEIKAFHRWQTPKIETFRNIRPERSVEIARNKVVEELKSKGMSIEDILKRLSQELEGLNAPDWLIFLTPTRYRGEIREPKDLMAAQKQFGKEFSLLSEEEQMKRVLREAELMLAGREDLFSELLSKLPANKKGAIIQEFIAVKKRGNNLTLDGNSWIYQILEKVGKKKK